MLACALTAVCQYASWGHEACPAYCEAQALYAFMYVTMLLTTTDCCVMLFVFPCALFVSVYMALVFSGASRYLSTIEPRSRLPARNEPPVRLLRHTFWS